MLCGLFMLALLNAISAHTYTTCVVDSFSVASVASTGKEGYTNQQVKSHFYGAYTELADPTKTTFECVDGRADHPIFGTPGGDFSEFAAALAVYFNQTGLNPTQGMIARLFRKFVNDVVTSDRPFYFHSDSTRMKMFYQTMSNLLGRPVTIFPLTKPSNQTEANLWLDTFSHGQYHGCGHLRLTLENPAEYGLTGNLSDIPKNFLKQFIEFFWKSDTNKDKIRFLALGGVLEAKAVVIFTGDCRKKSPKYFPDFLGSSVFLYTSSAVAQFREKIVAPFFTQQSSRIRQSKFLQDLIALTSLQLDQTLTKLAPANSVPIVTVTANYNPDSYGSF